MSSTDLYPPGPTGRSFHRDRPSWFVRSESWLDERGKGAWIAAMILGFIFFWPIGLALLAYMIWSKRMFNRSACGSHRADRSHRHAARWAHHRAYSQSGNSAFDAYKTETLRRLEEEQENFEAFLQRLREAKDKSEFDTFMEDRVRRARDDSADGADDAQPEPA
jgi:hypothetical protein